MFSSVKMKYHILVKFSLFLMTNAKTIPFNITLHSIPTSQEQVNLITCVQEVFEEVQILVEDETKLTDDSVVEDVEKIIRREEEMLDLYKTYVISRITSVTNKHCSLDPRDKIMDLLEESKALLKDCLEKSKGDILTTTATAKNVTDSATTKGYGLLNSLRACAKVPAFGLIPCYKRIIDTEVKPVKIVMLEMIREHKRSHSKIIEIRNEANECIDTISEGYKILIDIQYKNAINCQ